MNWSNQRPRKPTHEKVPVENGSAGEYSFASKIYVLHAMSQLIENTHQELKKLRGGEKIEIGMCLPLLQYYGWSSWKLQKEAREHGFYTIQKTTGVQSRKPLYVQDSSYKNRDCEVCGKDQVPPTHLHSLECYHWFCVKCWKIYLSAEFETTKPKITCMKFGCNLVIYDEKVKNIDGITTTLLKKFDDWKFNVYLQNSSYTKCPGPKCTWFVKVLQRPTRVRKITCQCGKHVYVNPCCNEWHAPVPCKAWQMWHQHIPGTDGAVEKDGRYYKLCPGKRCGIAIERNEGCLHMTCSKCHHEFCWLCLKPWKSVEHSGATRVCSIMTRENTKPISEETLLFRDGRFNINFKMCEKYKDPNIKANIQSKYNNNRKVLKAFELSTEEVSLTRYYKLFFHWRNSLVALYVFDFFVYFLKDAHKAWFEIMMQKFGARWDRLSHLLQHDLRLVKQERNIREWFKKMETLAKRVEETQKQFLRGINKLTDHLAYEFRIPL